MKKAEEIEQAKTNIANQQRRDKEPVLYIGDGINHQPSEPYDLLLTDPPYSTDIDDIEEFASSWLPIKRGEREYRVFDIKEHDSLEHMPE